MGVIEMRSPYLDGNWILYGGRIIKEIQLYESKALPKYVCPKIPHSKQ